MKIRSLSAIAFVAILSTNVQALELKTDADAMQALGVEIADMRNMLTAYVMNSTGMKYKDPEKRLKTSMSNFEDLMSVLKTNYAKDAEVVKDVDLGMKAWAPFKKALGMSLDKGEDKAKLKEGALFVHDNTRKVIVELEDIKKEIAKNATIPNKEQYNAALTIAATSRGYASHYMLKMWQVPDPTIQKHWDRLSKNHLKGIDTIKKSKFAKDPKVEKMIKKFEKNYTFFNHLYGGMGDKYMPSLMDKKTSESYKKAMELANIILKDK